jgi:hypothetical protein
MFARRFVADEKEKARQLNIAAQDDFRSIVYGYMSRVRRGDAGLAFPDRKVQMHPVTPTDAEIELSAWQWLGSALIAGLQREKKLVSLAQDEHSSARMMVITRVVRAASAGIGETERRSVASVTVELLTTELTRRRAAPNTGQ